MLDGKLPSSYITFMKRLFLIFLLPLALWADISIQMDINKTIIAVDTAQKKSMEHVLNLQMSERYIALWDESQKEAMSYDAYVDSLFPGDRTTPSVKKPRRAMKGQFLQNIEKANHPIAIKVRHDYDLMVAKLSESQGGVFPSFYRLIDYLEKKGERYTLTLRSFGGDGPLVVEAINKTLKRPYIQNNYSIKSGLIKGLNLNQTFALLNTGEHKTVQDDWPYWNAQGENRHYGKPFMFAPSDGNHYFFLDDNVELATSEKDVVKPLNIETMEVPANDKLPGNAHILRVDTCEAILNDDYFIDWIKQHLES